MRNEKGFTLIEVAMATLITAVGLVFLASLFIVAMNQNRGVKQFTATTALAQWKIEELQTKEQSDSSLNIGGGLNVPGDPAQTGYNDTVYVDPATGLVTATIPSGATPIYHRYWKIEADPAGLTTAKVISARVVADQPGYGRAAEETTLTTTRSW
jgi:prepilin-type N-terminal cleavage/methylation domain-containing protein